MLKKLIRIIIPLLTCYSLFAQDYILFENIYLQSSSKIPSLSFMEADRIFIYDHRSNKLKYILSGENKTKESDYEDFFWEIKRIWKDVYRALEIIKNSMKEKKEN